MKLRRVAIAVASAWQNLRPHYGYRPEHGAADNQSIFGLGALSSARRRPRGISPVIIVGKRQSQRSPTQPFGSSRVTLH